MIMGEVQDDDDECDLSKKCNKKTQYQINVEQNMFSSNRL